MSKYSVLQLKNNFSNSSKRILSRNWRNMLFALSLAIVSSLFVETSSRFSSLEHEAPPFSLAILCQWDCGWYTSIVADGYHRNPVAHPKGDAANWAFFPAFPLFAKAVALTTGVSAQFALILSSKVFLIFSLWAFLALVEKELGSDAKLLAGLVVAFNPYIIYAHAGYTETLYFFLTTLSFLFLHGRRFILAGMAGALLSATRLVGIVFLFPYLLNSSKFLRENNLRSYVPAFLLGALLVPLGLGLYMAYLHLHVGDALAFKHIQVAWGRSVENPFSILIAGFSASGWERFFALSALASLAMSIWLVIQRRLDYALFLVIVTLIPLSTGLWSMPRYIFWQMPFLFGMVNILMKNSLLGGMYLVVSGGVGAVVVVSWTLGRTFVI
jgi:hypothetical protein